MHVSGVWLPMPVQGFRGMKSGLTANTFLQAIGGDFLDPKLTPHGSPLVLNGLKNVSDDHRKTEENVRNGRSD